MMVSKRKPAYLVGADVLKNAARDRGVIDRM
jgi:hypothetical protein